MDSIGIVAGILAVLLVGVISPGPSFVLVAQTAVSASRRHGLAAALGMGLGAMLLAALALLGLQTLLVAVPWLYVALKLVGGLYLMYLAVRVWRGARQPLMQAGDGAVQTRRRRSFLLALGTMLSNPKAAVQYGVIFAALLPRTVPASLPWVLLPAIFLLETGWYALVAVLLSSSSPRQTYLRCKTSIDRVTSGVLGMLGLKLALSAR